METTLKEIISKSTFQKVPGSYVYAKAKYRPSGKHFLVTEDNDEITVVTERDQLRDVEMIEQNKDVYSLIALNVSIPFYSVGLLATVSAAIAELGMNILIVSTYSKDYILVKQDLSDKAESALINLGFSSI